MKILNDRMEEIEIIELTEAGADYLTEFNRLLQQLTTSDVQMGMEELEGIIASENSHLFVLLYENRIAGMATVGNYQTPTGPKYWIEDVVVDDSLRGKSLGKALVQYAIDYVGKDKKATLMLTSKPQRIAANKLYQSVGFQTKETNIYKMTFDKL